MAYDYKKMFDNLDNIFEEEQEDVVIKENHEEDIVYVDPQRTTTGIVPVTTNFISPVKLERNQVMNTTYAIVNMIINTLASVFYFLGSIPWRPILTVLFVIGVIVFVITYIEQIITCIVWIVIIFIIISIFL